MDIAGTVRGDIAKRRTAEHAKGDARKSGFNETHRHRQNRFDRGGPSDDTRRDLAMPPEGGGL
jgi:hypothetical protein